MRLGHRDERGVLVLAAVDVEFAARIEGTAGAQADQVRRHPFDRVELFLADFVQPRH